jgi:IS30 family transposase
MGSVPGAWFCDPNSLWQKGAVENANKRIRRFIPGDTDLATHRRS